jgi:hypothetical protein
MSSLYRRSQKFTIIAQDPSVTVWDPGLQNFKILTTQVEIPAEELAPGPRGYRVQVIDYDSSTGILYPPFKYRALEDGQYNDPFLNESDQTLLNDPGFHAQNVYAIIMRILARFEFALGRRVSWSFRGHQLHVAPHAFADANAFYSKYDRALMFGYFPKSADAGGACQCDDPTDTGWKIKAHDLVFSCLSHDVVAHETTHALVDGLRERYTDPSSPEQAGFHEGYADVVALLSVFSLPAIVERIVDEGVPDGADDDHIAVHKITDKKILRESMLFGLGKEMGGALGRGKTAGRGTALRRSVTLEPREDYAGMPEFMEPHRRGELLVAAMLNAFMDVWGKRVEGLGSKEQRRRKYGRKAESGGGGIDERQGGGPDEAWPTVYLDRHRVVEEGASVADHLLTMAIRALDYCPPTDLEFCDYLSALLTADTEIRPDDTKYNFRRTLLDSFESYGIRPASNGKGREPGIWEPPGAELNYERTHIESIARDPDEMFRFIWENRDQLGLEEDAYTRILSVRPCVRINPDDGFVLRETVAEYYQILSIVASELKHFGIRTPDGMLPDQPITLYGGGTLIFDEFARVKFHIRNRLLNPVRQSRRLEYLWKYGYYQSPEVEQPDEHTAADRRFAQMHRQRFGSSALVGEGPSYGDSF